MSRKKFGISASVNKALTQTIKMAETEVSNLYSTEILIERIKLDPQNPRKHKLQISDLPNGPSNSDPEYTIKMEEFQSLSELATSITKEGLLHPIVVIDYNSDFMLVTGERRFMASIIAGKKIIESRVFKQKPKEKDIRIIQWIENFKRKDLPLYNKLLNVKSVIETYNESSNNRLSALELANLLSMSRQSAQYFCSILSNELLMDLIQKGEISTFRKARELAVCTSKEEMLSKVTKPQDSKPKQATKAKKFGRRRMAINMGRTKKIDVVKFVAQSVLKNEAFSQYSNEFKESDWNSLESSTKAFSRLLNLLEKEFSKDVVG